MKFKIPKILWGYIVLLVVTVSAGTAQAGKYDGVNLPSIIPTAYQDAQISATKDQKSASDANADANSDGAGSDEKKQAEKSSENAKKSMENLNTNVKHLMDVGNFGTTGLFFGPTSGNSDTDAYGVLTSSAGLDNAGIASFGTNTGNTQKVEAYHAFGLALTKLKDDARQTDPGVIGFEKAVSGMENMAKAFSTFGIRMLHIYNPLPVVASFYDSSILSNSKYAGNGYDTEGNKLIAIVNSNDTISGFIRLFGDPITIGGVTTSRAYMMTAVVVFIMIGYAAFQKLWNGASSGTVLRKAVVKILIASIATPLIAVQGSNLLSWVNDVRQSDAKSKEVQVISNNLNIYNWYKNAAFGLPAGTSLQVRNGRFMFTPDIVYAINKHASVNKISADGSRNDLKDATIGGKGILSLGGQKTPQEQSDDSLAKELESMATTNDNTSKVTFAPSYGLGSSSAGGTVPWDTSDLTTYAEALGGNQKYEPKTDDVVNNQYVNVNGLSASGSGINFTYTGSGTEYGISPIAAFNMMATTFNDNGFTVSTNTGDISTPTVATSVIRGTASQDVTETSAPTLVKLVMIIAMMSVSVKALLTVFTTGIGSLFRGGLGATVGSSEGMGTLIGGVLALVFGILGISVIMTIAMDLVDVIWGFISKYIFSTEVSQALDDVGDSLLGSVADVPLLGKFLKGMIKGVLEFVMVIVGCMFLPQLVKVPIVAFGEFMGGIPSMVSDRFKAWENNFTGDYRTPSSGMFSGGGSSGGGYGGGMAMREMKEKEREKRSHRTNALKTGGAMMAGAGLSLLGARLAYGKTDNHKEGSDSLNENNNETDVLDETKESDQDVNESLQTNDERTDQNEHSEQNAMNEQSGTDGAPTLDEPTESDSVVQGHDAEGGDAADSTPFSESSDETAPTKDDGKGTQSLSNQSENGKDGESGVGGQDSGASLQNAKDGDSNSTQISNNQNTSSATNKLGGPDSQMEGQPKDATLNKGDTKISSNIDTDVDNHKDGDAKSHVDMNQDSKVSLNNQDRTENKGGTNVGVSGSSQESGAKSLSGEAKTKSDTASTKDGTSKSGQNGAGTSGAKSLSGESKTSPNAPGTSNGPSGVSKQTQNTGDTQSGTKPKKEIGRFRRAVGLGAMAAGGQMTHGEVGRGKDAAKMAGAGLLHAVGGISGTHRVTGKIAQGQIDKRNERLLRAGRDVPDKLSTMGETRKDAQERASRNIHSKDRLQRNKEQAYRNSVADAMEARNRADK